MIKPGALTVWRPQRKGQVRTEKETSHARGTHLLETMDKGTSQDTERKQLSHGYSQTGQAEGGTSQDTETSNQASGTYQLETTKRGTSQNTEGNQPSQGHSHPRDHRGIDKLGH